MLAGHPSTENPAMSEHQETLTQQHLTEHLAELRSCIIISLLATAVGFFIAYGFIETIANWFLAPLVKVMPKDASLIFISYQESFFFYLKLALTVGLLLASPVIFSQIWRFVTPGLYQHEKKVLLPFTVVSTCCFLSGAAFGYVVVFPPAFRFLLGYSNAFLEPLPAVSEYFSLALQLLIAFGVVFELPVFMIILAKVGVVNAVFLAKHRKYAVLIAFIVAAIVTPTPDPINQTLMAVPLIVLYEISIIAVRFFVKKPLAVFAKREGTMQDCES
jgi:sec-independent protein translocase protein TatC